MNGIFKRCVQSLFLNPEETGPLGKCRDRRKSKAKFDIKNTEYVGTRGDCSSVVS
jgi:hypothetical protein